jgi:hypothetical protein
MWLYKYHAKNVETKSVSWYDLIDIEVKWRFVTILQALSNSDRYARNIIPVSIVLLMYAKHVLRVALDYLLPIYILSIVNNNLCIIYQ